MRGDGGRIADAVPARQAPAKITRDSKSRGRRAGDRRDLESLPIFSHWTFPIFLKRNGAETRKHGLPRRCASENVAFLALKP